MKRGRQTSTPSPLSLAKILSAFEICNIACLPCFGEESSVVPFCNIVTALILAKDSGQRGATVSIWVGEIIGTVT